MNWKRAGILLLIGTMLMGAGLRAPEARGELSVTLLDEIRVALFIDTGQRYRGTTPVVTLSSDSGLHIGIREADAYIHWITRPGSGPVRSSPDQYMVLLTESGSASTARSLQGQIAATSAQEAFIFVSPGPEQPVYRVYVGPYASREQANTALQTFAADSKVAPYLQEKPASITGPLHLSAGTYASEAEARERLTALGQSGLNAYIAVRSGDTGQPVYSVWTGEASGEEELQALKSRAEGLGVALQAAETDKPYLLQRDELVPADIASAPVPHYRFQAGGQRVWIEPAGGTIRVRERLQRSYRGGIELTDLYGKMAVINEVPLEPYLYSVVGAEIERSWPAEVLKAQAVAARTYALHQGYKYMIAHISDSTFDQVYRGIETEFPEIVAAVDATAGQVLVDEEGLIPAYYFSNGGGITADPSEVLGNPLPQIRSVPSPDDHALLQRTFSWYRVVLADGTLGYIREDLVTDTGRVNAAGLPVLQAAVDNTNLRAAPYVDNTGNPAIARLSLGDTMTAIERTAESNAFSWVRGPFTSRQLLDSINPRLEFPIAGQLQKLEVTGRGDMSGRVTEIQANGQVIPVTSPDGYRSVMQNAPSTRFEIEQTGRYTILGADGKLRTHPETQGQLHVMGAGSSAAVLQSSHLYIMNGQEQIRAATIAPEYRLIGSGFGHGLGMSQWGAVGLAELGYDYTQILLYYYYGASLVQVVKD